MPGKLWARQSQDCIKEDWSTKLRSKVSLGHLYNNELCSQRPSLGQALFYTHYIY